MIEANDAAIIDEEYEPIETSNMADACYENVDQPQASYENIDQPQASYENIDQPQANYENIDQPQASYENIDNQLVDDDVAGVYENVNVYEDVVPPPPTSTETEEIVYHQVKFFRKSVQEVNELLEKNVTDVVPANVTPVSVAGVVDVVPQRDTTTSDRTSIKTNTPAHSVNDRKPTKPMKPATSTTSATSKSDASPIETTNQKDAMSLSLPSLSSSSSKLAQLAATTSKLFQSHPQPQEKHSEPLKHIENDSITSKRRLESEIGRDLLRERRTRNEIQNSRRSESNLSSTAAPIIQVNHSSIIQQKNFERFWIIFNDFEYYTNAGAGRAAADNVGIFQFEADQTSIHQQSVEEDCGFAVTTHDAGDVLWLWLIFH